jgi:hypothetical protein
MAYGHAERTLAAIQRLEAETVQLLDSQDHLDPDQEEWLREVTWPDSPHIRAPGAVPPACRIPVQARRVDQSSR